jgi:hypothetical protein
MEGVFVVFVILAGSAATGVFVVAGWRYLVRPALAHHTPRRRAAIVACGWMPALSAPVLALLDLTDGKAFALIAAITVVSIGLGIWLGRRRANSGPASGRRASRG